MAPRTKGRSPPRSKKTTHSKGGKTPKIASRMDHVILATGKTGFVEEMGTSQKFQVVDNSDRSVVTVLPLNGKGTPRKFGRARVKDIPVVKTAQPPESTKMPRGKKAAAKKTTTKTAPKGSAAKRSTRTKAEVEEEEEEEEEEETTTRGRARRATSTVDDDEEEEEEESDDDEEEEDDDESDDDEEDEDEDSDDEEEEDDADEEDEEDEDSDEDEESDDESDEDDEDDEPAGRGKARPTASAPQLRRSTDPHPGEGELAMLLRNANATLEMILRNQELQLAKTTSIDTNIAHAAKVIPQQTAKAPAAPTPATTTTTEAKGKKVRVKSFKDLKVGDTVIDGVDKTRYTVDKIGKKDIDVTNIKTKESGLFLDMDSLKEGLFVIR